MDFSKAFDRVRPSLSADPLEANGWPTRLTKLIVCLVEAREVCHIRWAVACQLWLLGASEWLRQDQRRRKDENNSSAAAAGQQLNRHNATERYQHGRGEHGRPHSDQELRNRPVADLSGLETVEREDTPSRKLGQTADGRTKIEIRNACVEQGFEEWQQKSVTRQSRIICSGLQGKKQIQRVLKNRNNDYPCRPRSRGATQTTTWDVVRVLCISSFAYGWIEATPTNELMDSMAVKVWAGKRSGLRGAAKYLKWDVEGANTHLDAVLPYRLLGIVLKLVRQEKVTWKAPPHTVVSILLEIDRNRTIQMDTPHSGGDQRCSSDGKRVVAGTSSSPDQRKIQRKSTGPLLQHDQAP